MDTSINQSQGVGGTERRRERIGDILIRAWHVGFAGVIGGIARVFLAIEIGTQLAFESIGLLGRCYL
jgi:hypothetical protein